MIVWAKMDFEIVCSAVIPSGGPTLGDSRALRRHKILIVGPKYQKSKKTIIG